MKFLEITALLGVLQICICMVSTTDHHRHHLETGDNGIDHVQIEPSVANRFRWWNDEDGDNDHDLDFESTKFQQGQPLFQPSGACTSTGTSYSTVTAGSCSATVVGGWGGATCSATSTQTLLVNPGWATTPTSTFVTTSTKTLLIPVQPATISSTVTDTISTSTFTSYTSTTTSVVSTSTVITTASTTTDISTGPSGPTVTASPNCVPGNSASFVTQPLVIVSTEICATTVETTTITPTITSTYTLTSVVPGFFYPSQCTSYITINPNPNSCTETEVVLATSTVTSVVDTTTTTAYFDTEYVYTATIGVSGTATYPALDCGDFYCFARFCNPATTTLLLDQTVTVIQPPTTIQQPITETTTVTSYSDCVTVQYDSTETVATQTLKIVITETTPGFETSTITLSSTISSYPSSYPPTITLSTVCPTCTLTFTSSVLGDPSEVVVPTTSYVGTVGTIIVPDRDIPVFTQPTITSTITPTVYVTAIETITTCLPLVTTISTEYTDYVDTVYTTATVTSFTNTIYENVQLTNYVASVTTVSSVVTLPPVTSCADVSTVTVTPIVPVIGGVSLTFIVPTVTVSQVVVDVSGTSTFECQFATSGYIYS